MTMLERLSFILLAFSLVAGRAHAEFGVVSSASPEATAAGVEVLEAGGNAIDAAIAVQFALAVTEPAMSGLGGGTQIILKKPGETPIVINGTTFAPGLIPESATRKQVQTGRTASTIPSTVRVFDFAYKKYGSGNIAWGELLAPAVRYAEEGWVVGPFRARVYRRHEEDLRSDSALAKLFLTEGKHAPREGEVVKMPVLGKTLRRLAEKGGMDFYTGDIAQEIAADMAKHGGWITAGDLSAFPDPVVAPALATTYRGYGVYSLRPPAGGWAVLQALNILEREPLDRLNKEGDARSRALLRALRAAHGSRRNAPIGGGTSLGEAESLEAQITKETAAALWKKSGGETTHFSIVDKDGMIVAVTTSINRYFGAWAASPKLGFLYNNYMAEFETDAPDHPFALKPSAAPLSSMSASIVTKNGEPVLVVGSPGSARIISAVTQVISHFLDVGKGVGAAVAAERVHALPEDKAYMEARLISQTLLKTLADDGFSLQSPDQDLVIDGLNAYFGGVHAIGKEELGWRGAADPRRDGTVGYANEGGWTPQP